MIFLNYSEIVLSPHQKQILKHLSKNPNSQLEQFNDQDIDFLVELHFIKQKLTYDDSTEAIFLYSLDPQAYNYSLFAKRDVLRTWYPYIISTISLILSVIAILRTL